MRKTKSENRIVGIAIERLAPHPDSPNRMSKGNFAKLVRNIERTGRYEPLIVRPCRATSGHSCESRNPDSNGNEKHGCFQIINGHYRWRALQELGYKSVEAVIWDIDDGETDILLATLNRLGGSNVLDKKLALLKRLNQRINARDLAKRLPHTAGQIERLVQMSAGGLAPIRPAKSVLAHPKVFFLDDAQHEMIENALSRAREGRIEKTKAARNAAALTQIARAFTQRREPSAGLENPESRTP